MGNQSVTAANVLQSAAARLARVILGAAGARGQPVYLDPSDSNSAKLCDADAEASAEIFGILLNTGDDGQLADVVLEDPDFNPGFTCVLGEIYVLSTTAGAICLKSDLATGDYVTVVGVGNANGRLNYKPIISGAAIPA